MITAKIVADSKNEFGHRLTTMVVTFPRFILAEFNTHRLFSRNSASSRAIPASKMLKMVEQHPFIPIAWQKEHTGMQGTEYLDDVPANEIDKAFIPQMSGKELFESVWNGGVKDVGYETPGGSALYHAIKASEELNRYRVTKQITNRLLEPFMWHTVIVTSSEWDNFFNLRCPKYYFEPEDKYFKSWKEFIDYHNDAFSDEILYDQHDILFKLRQNKGQAEIHMMALAEAMYDAYRESVPKQLAGGEWHIPFGDNINTRELAVAAIKVAGNPLNVPLDAEDLRLDWNSEEQFKIQVATARCARVSYLNYEGTDDYEKDFALYKQLFESGHMSPFEHVAKAMTREDLDNFMKIEKGKVSVGWCRNFCGFIQMRAIIEE